MSIQYFPQFCSMLIFDCAVSTYCHCINKVTLCNIPVLMNIKFSNITTYYVACVQISHQKS